MGSGPFSPSFSLPLKFPAARSKFPTLTCLLALALALPSHGQDSPQDYLLLPSENLQTTPQDFLRAHNSARARVDVGPVSWDNNLAAYAQNYLSQHIGDFQMVHSRGPYGENLAWSSGDMSGTSAVTMWVNERVDYDYNSNTCRPSKVCGHYTQVVWRNSVRIGCAKLKCHNGGTLISCNYDPRGNIIGQKPY